MNKKNCGECAKYRGPDCRPDQCLPSYALWSDPHEDHSRFCELCGKRLTRKRTKKEGNEYRVVDLECPVHGAVGTHECQYRSKVRTAVTA